MNSADNAAGAMDRMYRGQRHIYDASRRYYLLGRDRLIASLKPPAVGTVLEIGCGTGRNLIHAARRYPGCVFYGIDISSEMLKTASAAVAQAGLSSRITLAQGDATAFDARSLLGRSRFDRIYFSYTLSMIPPWQSALAHAMGLVGEEGELHLVDFGQCEGLPATARAALFRWLALFHVEPRQRLSEVLEDLARKHDATLEFTPLYRGYAWQARFVLS
ncbi:class I SAM-dependent methyltransferase [Aestuariivirga sp.]|uniref:class I SAM-dependent methyltransferase n=1 Tax=Aestuariivirga sp. TaxID=2650926 RepID=UPI0039E535CE